MKEVCRAQYVGRGTELHALWARRSRCSQPRSSRAIILYKMLTPMHRQLGRLEFPPTVLVSQPPSPAPPSAGALWTSGNQVSGLHGQKALQYGCQGKGATQFTYLHTHRFLRKHKCKAEGTDAYLQIPKHRICYLRKPSGPMSRMMSHRQ